MGIGFRSGPPINSESESVCFCFSLRAQTSKRCVFWPQGSYNFVDTYLKNLMHNHSWEYMTNAKSVAHIGRPINHQTEGCLCCIRELWDKWTLKDGWGLKRGSDVKWYLNEQRCGPKRNRMNLRTQSMLGCLEKKFKLRSNKK